MIKRIRIFVFDYWHYLLFGIFALVVILGVIYFNRRLYEQRQERLNAVSMDRVSLSELQPPASEPEGTVDGLLLPQLSVYIPLPESWSIREEWGKPVTVMERRIPEVPLQEAPPKLGPDVSP